MRFDKVAHVLERFMANELVHLLAAEDSVHIPRVEL